MLLRFLSLLLAGFLTFSCTRPPVPAPLTVSTQVPLRLIPQPFTVAGRVIDAETGRPVPGATVRGYRQDEWSWQNRPLQAVTDAQGRFAFAGAVARGDTSRLRLAVNTALHTGLLRCPPGSGQQVEIRVQPYFRFQPDSCLRAADSVYFNPQAPPLSWRPGQFYAWLIHNPHATPGRTLRTITLRRQALRNTPELEAGEPFRLRILAIDPQTGAPGEDLLTENMVFGFPPSGRAFTFALWEFQIPAEADRFYVGLEPIIAGDKFYTWAPLPNYHPIGPQLRAPCAFADTRTWIYPYNSKLGWQRLPAAQNPWPRYESIISLETSLR